MSDKNAGDHGGPKTFHIHVNGREREVPGPTLSYEEVVKLAFPEPGGILYKVQYTGPNMPDGTLAPGGEPVQLKNGMKFDVVPTNKS